MSLTSKLQLIKQDVNRARSAITEMGGSVTTNGGTSQLEDDIKTIPVTLGMMREISQDGIYRVPVTPFTFRIPDNAKNMDENSIRYGFYKSAGLTSVVLDSIEEISGDYAMNYTFFQCPNLVDVDLRSLETVSGNNSMSFGFLGCESLKTLNLSGLKDVTGSNAMASCFRQCPSIEQVNMPNLETVGDYTATSAETNMSYCFYQCPSIEQVNMPKLKSVGYSAFLNAFQSCTSLLSIDVSSLEKIGKSGFANAFQLCSSIQTVSFNKLNKIDRNGLSNTFRGCASLKTMYFPSLDNDSFLGATSGSNMGQMLLGVTGCTVHLPAILNNTIRNLSFIRNGFSGTNTTILYDL